MKLTINNRNVALPETLDSLINTRLRLLGKRVRIDEALVLVERRAEASPPFRVELFIAVPGPNLHSEATDCTAVQAFTKALGDIEHRLRDRDLKRRIPKQGRRTTTPAARATAYR